MLKVSVNQSGATALLVEQQGSLYEHNGLGILEDNFLFIHIDRPPFAKCWPLRAKFS
jgi:hypothetical protein